MEKAKSKHILAQLRIRCTGHIHEILLTDKLQIVLKDHSERDLSAEVIVNATSGKEFSRCHKILNTIQTLRETYYKSYKTYEANLKTIPRKILKHLSSGKPLHYKFIAREENETARIKKSYTSPPYERLYNLEARDAFNSQYAVSRYMQKYHGLPEKLKTPQLQISIIYGILRYKLHYTTQFYRGNFIFSMLPDPGAEVTIAKAYNKTNAYEREPPQYFLCRAGKTPKQISEATALKKLEKLGIDNPEFLIDKIYDYIPPRNQS